MILVKKAVNSLIDLKVLQEHKYDIEAYKEGVMVEMGNSDLVYVETETDVTKPTVLDYDNVMYARKLSAKYRKAVAGYKITDTHIQLTDTEKSDNFRLKNEKDVNSSWSAVPQGKSLYETKPFNMVPILSYIADNKTNEKGVLFETFQNSWLLADGQFVYWVSSNGMSKHYVRLTECETSFLISFNDDQEKTLKDLSRALPETVVKDKRTHVVLEFTHNDSTVAYAIKKEEVEKPNWLTPPDLNDSEDISVFIEDGVHEDLVTTEMRQRLQVRSASARHTIGYIFKEGVVYRFQKNPESRLLEDEIETNDEEEEGHEEDGLFNLEHHEPLASYETDEWLDTLLIVHHAALKDLMTEEGILNVHVLPDELVIANNHILYVIRRVDED